MGNKFKPWQSPERRPKKFRKLSSLGESFDPNDRKGRDDRNVRQDKNQRWRQNWDQEL